MIDHVNLLVSNLGVSRTFYRAILAPLGLSELMREGDAVGFGAQSWVFGIVGSTMPVTPLHLAFAASAPEIVGAFHDAALAAGAKDNGAPGERLEYGAGYYAAYVLDPDGHNVEAVFRGG